jgi:hypothetical protein
LKTSGDEVSLAVFSVCLVVIHRLSADYGRDYALVSSFGNLTRFISGGCQREHPADAILVAMTTIMPPTISRAASRSAVPLAWVSVASIARSLRFSIVT